MACVTIPLEEVFNDRIKAYPWVNWSQVGQEEVMKRKISESYKKVKQLSEEEQVFCDSIDWHPVDEYPLREEYIRELKVISKGKHIPYDLEKLKRLMESGLPAEQNSGEETY